MSVSTAPQPKRHHTVPRFYIEGFATNGVVWIYDRKKREFRPQTPINTAVQTGFYTLVDAEGNKHTDVEELLGRMEGICKPILDRLVRREELSAADRGNLGTFIATQYLRTPGFRKLHDGMFEHLLKHMVRFAFATPERAASEMQRMKDAGRDIFRDMTPEQAQAIMNPDQYTLRFGNSSALGSMVHLAPRFGSLFAQMDWTVLHAPEKRAFVTVDEPFILLPPADYKENLYGYGFTTPGAHKLVPLTQKACLLMTDLSKDPTIIHGIAPVTLIRSVNMNLTANAERFVIGPSEALVKSLVKATGVDKTEPRPRFRVG
ncbi:MAG TPA: DUF4238 domain-containing protein [Vicinamibacterales bacterium]|jgi:hypothetical protein